MTREEAAEIILNTAFFGKSQENIDEAIDIVTRCTKAWNVILEKLPQIAHFESDDGQELVQVYDVIHLIKDILEEKEWFRKHYTAEVAIMTGNTDYKKKIGHWILKQRNKSVDICCSVCGNTRVEEYAYNYTVDQLNKEDLQKLYKESGMYYCEKCGAKMLF